MSLPSDKFSTGFVQASTLRCSNPSASSSNSCLGHASGSPPKKRRKKAEAQKNKITNYFEMNVINHEPPSKPKVEKRNPSEVVVLAHKRPKKETKQSELSTPSMEFLYCLPTHIWENIFCHLPFIDMMWNVTRVCKRWRDIVCWEKYMTWKKEYHRLKASYDNPEAANAAYSLFSLTSRRKCFSFLIKYTPEFCHTPGSNMLTLLKPHQKFHLSMDFLKERHSDMFIDGVINPWVIVTTMVLLSETMYEIRHTLRLLTQNSSNTPVHDVVDSFYFIATGLLFFQNQFRINSGLHYRLYYALYLYENEQKIDRKDLTLFDEEFFGQQSMIKYGSNLNIRLSHEQARVINHELKPGQVVKVVSFAGTGKTTTLAMYARLRLHTKFLLIVFNKYAKKLTAKLKPYFILKHLSDDKIELNIYKRASVVIQIIEKFTVSSDEEITSSLVPMEIVVNENRVYCPTDADKRVLVNDARILWSKMIDEKDWSVKVTHDTYLKLFQLSKPCIQGYDCIIIDEAQDCNFAMLDIIMTQACPKILVGDPHQQIYAFRGARNSLENVQATHVYFLTQSFRFGPRIAYVASCILESLKNQFSKTLVGSSHLDFIDGQKVGQVAIIARKNSTLFDEAVQVLCIENKCRRAGFVGGLRSYGLDQLLDILYLKHHSDGISGKEKIKDKFISKFESFGKLQSYAENSDDQDLYGKIKLMLKHELHLEFYVSKIKEVASGSVEGAEIVFTTVHKAKGLEFDTVCLTRDFTVGLAPFKNMLFNPSVDEFNVLYVAATRAKKSLFLSPALYYTLITSRDTSEFLVARNLHSDATCCSCSQVINDAGCLLLHRNSVTIYPNQTLSSGPLCGTCASNPISTAEVLHPSIDMEPEFYNYTHESLKNIVGQPDNDDDDDIYNSNLCLVLRQRMGETV